MHNIFYIGLAWAQDRFSPRILIPVNMVLGGITIFFLDKATDFATLCFLFAMLSLWWEGAFWPAVLSAVRKSTADTNQGKIFGLSEGGRGAIELLQNVLTVGLYTILRLPEVWLVGIIGFTVYMAYTSMPFFLTYLQDLHALPVLAISIFGIVSTSGGRISMGVAQQIAEKVSRMDHRLGLRGEEKTLSDLIDDSERRNLE